MRVWVLGFRDEGVEFRVLGSGPGSKFRVWGIGFGAAGFEVWVGGYRVLAQPLARYRFGCRLLRIGGWGVPRPRRPSRACADPRTPPRVPASVGA